MIHRPGGTDIIEANHSSGVAEQSALHDRGISVLPHGSRPASIRRVKNIPGRLVTLGSLAILAGCASAPKDAGFSSVQSTVSERSGLRVEAAATDSSQAFVKASLTKPLSADDAVQIALLRNPSLQASFDELGIARGDLITAGTLVNPVLEGRVRWAQHTEGTNPELTLWFDLTDMVHHGKRKGAARAQLDAAVLRAGHAALSLAADVRRAYFDLQAASQTYRMQSQVNEAAGAQAELSRRQRSAGNINALDLAVEESAMLEARLALDHSRVDERLARQELARLLVLDAADSTWSVAAELPPLPASDPSATDLESLALSGRLDVQASKKEIEASQRELSYKKSFWIPSLAVGADAERAFDGEWAYGPAVQLSLPIFDRGQGGKAAAQAGVKRAEHGAAALESDVRQEVRSSSERMRAARDAAVLYRDQIIPTREKVVAESQKHYNFMLVGATNLLQAKRDEIAAYRGYIEAVRDYWIARTELERAVAAPLETK